MPMNLDAVGAVSDPGRDSWTSKDALLYALGVGAGQIDPTGFELEFTTENSTRTIAQRVLPTLPVVIAMGGGPGLPSWGDFDFRDAVARRAGRDRARPDPARRRGRVGRRASSASTTRARPRSCGSRPSRRTSTRGKPAFDDALRRVHPRRGWLRRQPRRRDRRPAEDARPQRPTTRSRTRPATTRRCSTASPATATRCTPTRRSPSSPASTGRSCTASAPTASPAARCCTSCAAPTSRKFKSMDARFSKPVYPGRHAHRAHVGRRHGPRALPDRQPGRHGRHRRRRLQLRITQARTGVSERSRRPLLTPVRLSYRGAEGDVGGADQGAVGAERAGDDPRAAGEVEAAARVELALARRRRTARRSRARPIRSRPRAAGRAGSRPTRPRGRRACRCARGPRAAPRPAGAPVMRAIAEPDASASRQPRAPHAHSRPSGSTITWPMWPALPSAPSSSRPSRTMPPPTPVDTTIAM